MLQSSTCTCTVKKVLFTSGVKTHLIIYFHSYALHICNFQICQETMNLLTWILVLPLACTLANTIDSNLEYEPQSRSPVEDDVNGKY